MTRAHSYFAYLRVDDIDALHAELVQRGAIIRQSPADSRGACAKRQLRRRTAMG
jgi:hypothetical protein